MELQTFINGNTDYVSKFKENNLYVRKYSQLKLILVKAKRDVEYDYENNEWMRYCRGVIINSETNRVVCIPPVKSFRKEEIITDNYDGEFLFEPLVDGVMINMFFHNDEWVISTRSNIGAKNKWDGKTPFHELFKKVNGVEWFDQLDRNNCYSFTLQHKDNRIITPVYKNLIFMNEVHNLGDVKILRLKWINPNYEYVEKLKVNNNNKFFTYIELRRSFKLGEYLKFFPEEQYLFDNYKNNYNMIKNELYDSYVSLKIKKEKEWSDIRYEFKPLIKDLHNDYMKGNGKINSHYINSYMERLPIGKLFFIYNRIF